MTLVITFAAVRASSCNLSQVSTLRNTFKRAMLQHVNICFPCLSTEDIFSGQISVMDSQKQRPIRRRQQVYSQPEEKLLVHWSYIRTSNVSRICGFFMLILLFPQVVGNVFLFFFFTSFSFL